MGWETRIFFAIGGDSTVKKKLTLASNIVSNVLFSKVVALDPSSVEERTDDYLLMDSCPQAGEIGLKARAVNVDGYYTLLELKTVVVEHHLDDNGDCDEQEKLKKSLARWIKSSRYVHGSITNREILLDFLASRPSSQQPQAKLVSKWIRNDDDDDDENNTHVDDARRLCIVRTEKRRCSATIVGGGLDVEEADIIFSLLDGNAGSSKTLILRSWAVEGDVNMAKLRSIATSWKDLYAQAVSAVGIKTAPAMWVASYPAMILQIPQLMSNKAEM